MKILKIIGLVSVLCTAHPELSAQTNFSFSYDNSGNMVQRSVQVFPPARIGKFDLPADSVYAFKIYPNPTNSFLNIEGPLPEGKTSAEISLTSVNGQLLRKDSYQGKSKTLPVNDLPPGLYLLEMRYSKTEASVYKIIVSN